MLGTDARPASRLARCSIALVLFGLALRAYHYGRNPSVWHDEAALILNVISKSFAGLLGPLYFAEAGPPLFLWLERAARLLLGDGVFSLRLLPFAASCCALLLVAFTARRLLSTAGATLAILFFACSRSLLWHASEAKPYALDVALAAVLPALACGPLRSWSLEKRVVFYALLAPVVIMLSYPGCFLMGGVILSLLPDIWRSNRRQAWMALAFLAMTTGVAFLLLLAGPIHAQRCADMESCWTHAFAPWDRPWRIPLWTAGSLFGLSRYCLDPVGDFLLLPALVGFASLWRRGKAEFVVLLTAPILLAFAAACLRAYPFDSSRVIVFATPALVLGVGEGCVVLFGRLVAQVKTANPILVWSRWCALAAVALLLATPVGLAIDDVIHPWPRPDVASAASYVMRMREPSEMVVGNHWEHAYYFRSLHKQFVFWDGRPMPQVNRIWLVITAGTEAETDLLCAAAMGDRWHCLRQERFDQCRVLELAK